MSKIKSLLDSRFRLLVSLPKNKLEFASAAIEAGADAIKVHLNCHHFASGTTFGSWAKEQGVILEILALAQAARGGEGIPVGIVSGDTTQPTLEEMFEIVAAGFDFWDLFAAHTPPEWLSLPTGRMVAVDDHWDAQLMGGLHALGVQIVEGSIVPKTAYRTPLNAVDLVNYHRLVRASAPMPVVIPTQKSIQPDQVSFLQKAGASGLVIGAVVTGLEPAGLHTACLKYAEAIGQLPNELPPA